MSKPVIDDTRWAVTAGGSESPNISAPDGTLKDDGYENDAVPEGFEWNYWRRKAHAWFQYLNAQVFEGNATVLGTFTVGGAASSLVSTSFTASSVTSQLAIVAHGRVAGEGPLRTFNVGGAPPGGLPVATDYWAVPVDADHLRLAKSRALALSGQYVRLTSNGTGTNTIASTGSTSIPSTIVVNGDVAADRLLSVVNATYMADASQWAISAQGSGAFEAPSFLDQIQIPSGTFGRIVHGLRAPSGTLLTKIRFIYDLAAAGNSVTLQVGSQRTDGSQFSEQNLVVDSTSTTRVAVDVTNLGVDANGNFDQSAGPHAMSGDRWYWIALSFGRASGTIIAYGAVINPP